MDKHIYTMNEVAEILGLDTYSVKGSHEYYDCVNLACDVKAEDRKFNINFVNDKFNCFGCGSSGNPVTLYRLATGLDISSALKNLAEGKVMVEPKILAKYNSKANDRISLPLLSSKIATDIVKDRVYNALLSLLTLNASHKEKLLQRGLSELQIAKGGYKSLPTIGKETIATKIMDMGINVEGVPGFYKAENGAWSIYAPATGFVVPIILKSGLVPALQIRQDTLDSKFKYIWLSTAKKHMGAAQTARIHFEGEFKKGLVFIIEGAFKAKISYALCEQMGLDMSAISFLALSSVTTQVGFEDAMEEIIKTSDVTTFIEAFDKDKASNPKVEKSQKKLWEKMRVSSIGKDIKLLSMSPSMFYGKGIDDHLKYILKGA